jgi:hypothetical protein
MGCHIMPSCIVSIKAENVKCRSSKLSTFTLSLQPAIVLSADSITTSDHSPSHEKRMKDEASVQPMPY